MENKSLKWFGHCLRREHNQICAKSLRLEVSGRSRGRPKKTLMDNIQGDMNKCQLTEDMAQYQMYWMTKILASRPCTRRWSRKVREVGVQESPMLLWPPPPPPYREPNYGVDPMITFHLPLFFQGLMRSFRRNRWCRGIETRLSSYVCRPRGPCRKSPYRCRRYCWIRRGNFLTELRWVRFLQQHLKAHFHYIRYLWKSNRIQSKCIIAELCIYG